MITELVVGVPAKVVERRMSHHLGQFERLTGITKTRRFEDGKHMLEAAIMQTLGHMKTNLGGLQALIVVTQSNPYQSPCMAVRIHHRLGLTPTIPAYDINHACDGFVFGLKRAVNNALLICADALRYDDGGDGQYIFSDAVACAHVVDNFNMPVWYHNDGSGADNIYARGGEMHMDGSAVFDFSTTKVPPLIRGFQKRQQCDILVQHQANKSMNELIAKRAGMPQVTSIEEYGNQSMCGIPTAIAHNEEKLLGRKLLLAGFGAGYTATLGAIRWSDKPVSKIVEIQ